MNGYSYTKLFSTILTSSLWSADPAVRLTFITMLALADATGRVLAVPSRIPAQANLPEQDVQRALEALENPDPESRNEAEGGRRIIPVQGGWQIVNYEYYRNLRDPDERKRQNRQAKRRQREREKMGQDGGRCQQDVSNGQQQSAESAQAEAEAEEEPYGSSDSDSALTPMANCAGCKAAYPTSTMIAVGNELFHSRQCRQSHLGW